VLGIISMKAYYNLSYNCVIWGTNKGGSNKLVVFSHGPNKAFLR